MIRRFIAIFVKVNPGHKIRWSVIHCMLQTHLYFCFELTQSIPLVRISRFRPSRIQCITNRDWNYTTHAKRWFTGCCI